MIEGLGFPLGTRGQMFYLDARRPNALSPRKRPKATLTPRLVTRRGEHSRDEVIGEEERADAIIMCVRHGDVLNQVLEMSGDGTTIVVTGVILPTEVNPGLWLRKRLRTVGVWIGPAPTPSKRMFELAMYLIAHKRLDPRPLISEIMPLEDVQKAIDSLYSGENIAVLLKP